MNSTVAMVVLAMAIVMGAVFLIISNQGMDPSLLWEALLKRLSQNPIDTLLHAAALLVVLAGVVVAYATRDATKAARLTLGPEGIDYYFPAPDWIPGVNRKWFIPWAKLKGVELNAMHFILTLHDGDRGRTLRILEWVEDRAAGTRPGKEFSLWRIPLTFKGRRAIIDEMPLVRALRERGINPAAAGKTVVDYDLFSSPAVRAVLMAMVVLAVYTVSDGILIEETWPNDPPYAALGLIGSISAMFVILFLFLKKVPAGVASGVGLLGGAVLMIAGYSGLLRINQLTDTVGLKSHEYVMRHPARFHPVQDGGGLPLIELKPHELWSSQRNGSRHRFELRRGGLGFYQLNTAPIRQAIQLYHEGYRDGPAAKPAK